MNRSQNSCWSRLHCAKHPVAQGWIKIWSGVLLLVTFLLASLAKAEETGSFQVLKDLVYSHSDREMTLDLFLPEGSAKPHPCVIVIQGGGFRAQDGQRFRWVAEYLAERGFAAALITYRGTPDHQYLDTISDTKAAVRYIRKASTQYGMDPDKIGATGSSAGGTLAALLAVTGDDPEYEGDGENPEFSSRIQAAVAFSGVFDFVARFTDKKQIALQPNVDTKIQTNGEWIGQPFSPDGENWLKASAINHVDSGDPAILFVHCKDDATVPWLQSHLMWEKMKNAGIESSTLYYETGGHGYKDVGEKRLAAMVKFFKERL